MRLIDADELSERLMTAWDTADLEGKKTVSEVMAKVVVPIVVGTRTIDAEPVRHGHWIHKFGYNGERHTICSSCGHDRCGHFNFSFCMDCGAKMDEEAPHDK